jgi:hypothetical protein
MRMFEKNLKVLARMGYECWDLGKEGAIITPSGEVIRVSKFDDKGNKNKEKMYISLLLSVLDIDSIGSKDIQDRQVLKTSQCKELESSKIIGLEDIEEAIIIGKKYMSEIKESLKCEICKFDFYIEHINWEEGISERRLKRIV